MTHEKQVVNYQTGEVDTVNDNFVQLYIDKLDLIIQMTSENPTAVKMFVWLLQHMDKRNALVISQEALAEALGLHRTTIFRCTNYLKEKKALGVVKSANTNIYAVNAQIAWKSDASGKKYALFDAAVYIAEFEQEGQQDKPLFDTQLIGHAKQRPAKKVRTGKEKPKTEEAQGFEAINQQIPLPDTESVSEATKGAATAKRKRNSNSKAAKAE